MLALTVVLVAIAAFSSMASAFHCRVGVCLNSRMTTELSRPGNILRSVIRTPSMFSRLTIPHVGTTMPKDGPFKNSALYGIAKTMEEIEFVAEQSKVWCKSTAIGGDCTIESGTTTSLKKVGNVVESESQNWKRSAASIASQAKLELMVQPSKRIVQLEYDYLSSSSIFTIRHKWWRKKLSAVTATATVQGLQTVDAATQVNELAGDAYLIDWWHSARKWGLLNDKLLEMMKQHRPKPAPSQNIPVDNSCSIEHGNKSDSVPGSSQTLQSAVVDKSIQDLTNKSVAVGAATCKGEDVVASSAPTSKHPPETVAEIPHCIVDAKIKSHLPFTAVSAIYTEPVMSTAMKEKAAAASALAAKKRQKQHNSARSNKQYKKKRRLLQKAQQKALQERALLTRSITAPSVEDSETGHSKESETNDTQLSNATKELEQMEEEEDIKHGEVPLAALHALCRAHQARVIVIGDVHGCADELCDLLREITYLPGDQILLLGDLVAKGPKSVEVIRMAMDLGALSVRGNHDHAVVRKYFSAVLPVYEEDISGGSKTTLKDGQSKRGSDSSTEKDKATDSEWYTKLTKHGKIAYLLSPEEIAWLGDLPYMIQSSDLGAVFVHAGLQRNVSLEDQQPALMMNMCSELSSGRISIASLKNFAWAPHWEGPLTAYFGHDTARGLQQCPWAKGLDTGCVYGGNLTAVLLPEERIVSVPARKAYLKYFGRNQDDFCV